MKQIAGVTDIVIGVDLVSISRFKRLLQKFDTNFTKQIFTLYELEEYGHSIQRLAVRYSAKEATSKALGTGLAHMSARGIPSTDIEVRTQSNGAPILYLYGRAEEIAQAKQIQIMKVSLSHERFYAIAMVSGICL
ncbi:holo-[acyl-carrier-protein] synthase [bacterium]|nr:holo-[acyl-carrier-protein] synthase [bacterium]